MILEVSASICTPRFWDVHFGWTDLEIEDSELFSNVSVLNVSLLCFKFKLYVFYGLVDDE